MSLSGDIFTWDLPVDFIALYAFALNDVFSGRYRIYRQPFHARFYGVYLAAHIASNQAHTAIGRVVKLCRIFSSHAHDGFRWIDFVLWLHVARFNRAGFVPFIALNLATHHRRTKRRHGDFFNVQGIQHDVLRAECRHVREKQRGKQRAEFKIRNIPAIQVHEKLVSVKCRCFSCHYSPP